MDNLNIQSLTFDVEVAQKLLALIDEELRVVTLNLCDSKSVEIAIQHTDQIIDQRLAAFKCHPLLGPVIQEMKKQYHSLILDRDLPSRSCGVSFWRFLSRPRRSRQIQASVTSGRD